MQTNELNRSKLRELADNPSAQNGRVVRNEYPHHQLPKLA